MSESGPDAPQGANGDGAAGGSRRPERPPVRALDPATAMRLTDGRPPLPALYLSDRLLVRSATGGGRPRGLDDLRDGPRQARPRLPGDAAARREPARPRPAHAGARASR